jgi:NTE family protein
MLILKTPPISKTININFLDITNQFYFQSIFAQKFMIGLGIEHQFLQINSETIAPTKTSIENSDYGNFYGYIKYDSYDKQYFPTKGWNFNSEIHNYLFSGNYSSKFKPFSIAKADAGIAIKISNKIVCQFQTEAGFSIGDKNIPYFDFALGGYGFIPVNNFKPFYGYDFLSLSGESYLKSAVVLDYKLFKKNHLNLSANYANIGNALFESIERFALPKHSGYALGYGLETILGPIEVKYSWSPEIRKGFTWFSIGFWF